MPIAFSHIKRNILLIAIGRISTILISFAIIRASFDFINNPAIYGLWLTILSTVSWISSFDLGIGNGLRNKLAESIAKNDFSRGRLYVSTCYILIFAVTSSFVLFFFSTSHFLPWQIIFPGTTIPPEDLGFLMLIIFSFAFFRFFFSLINSIAYAFQDSFIPSHIEACSSGLFLLGIMICENLDISRNIFGLAYLRSFSSLSVLIVFSLALFASKYRKVQPSARNFSPPLIKDTLSLGFRFFILQCCALIIFTTDNMIVLHTTGPEDVVSYHLTQKLFSVFSIAASIVLTPIWSAFTEAFTNNNLIWMKKTIKALLKLFFISTIAILLFSVFSSKFILFWIGSSVVPSNSLTLLVAASTILLIWNSIFSSMVNGIGKINIQLFTGLFGAVINIPISVFFASSLNLGCSGVVLGTIVSMGLSGILVPVQVFMMLGKSK